jgi:hypothetical protein
MNRPSNNSLYLITSSRETRPVGAVFDTPQRVLEEKGAETVKLRARTNGKTSFTALRAIFGAGKRLSFWIPAKEERMNARANVELTPQHSDGGWGTKTSL